MEINRRIISNDTNIILNHSQILSLEEKRKERYNELKLKLKSNFKESICNKLEAMKILKEIKDNDYYKLDGYKKFSEFLTSYNVAKSQAYNYLKIATAIEEGILEEQYVLENGFREVLSLIKDKEGKNLKKSRLNPIRPLRFQLKSQDSYDFYKSNTKFTSYFLDRVFEDEKEFLQKFMKEYKNLKNNK
ncbi:chromosome replication/partitioning protein [Borrelia turicatae]|uniref:Permease n=2 Tax=Borrelia turicatae TaxID=142 RepID=A0A172XD94_BORTU|nr:chromosome replication/partitioning protein [Borrelia turicatae]ANF34644.1 permease [Borrelia turicatae]ASJ27790.1 PF-49-type protein [Borrelia turicatae 91E135]UPA14256.1 chromosome replication/partitioning protein [Borrelia turicatae 91E135]UPA15852.1 chromosome replication/partitioning protein [Borrelia turicatae]